MLPVMPSTMWRPARGEVGTLDMGRGGGANEGALGAWPRREGKPRGEINKEWGHRRGLSLTNGRCGVRRLRGENATRRPSNSRVLMAGVVCGGNGGGMEGAER